MRQLLPEVADDVDPVALIAVEARPAPTRRPWLIVNMVCSVDGAIEVGGRSGPLAGPGDKAIFHALRGIADIVLVGAGTVRAEGYGPPKTGARLAIVSHRLDLDPAAKAFSGGNPIVLTDGASDPALRTQLAEVAEVIVAGDAAVDLDAGLRQMGATVVLCEGGPTLNGGLFAADLVDELRITIAPLVVGGNASRVLNGPQLTPPAGFGLAGVLEEDGFLFLRYVRS